MEYFSVRVRPAPTRIWRLAAGRTVVTQGAEWEHVVAVRSGALKMGAVRPSGRQLLISILGPGDVFAPPGAFEPAGPRPVGPVGNGRPKRAIRLAQPSRPATVSPGRTALRRAYAPWTVTALTESELLVASRHDLVAGPGAGPLMAQMWAGIGARIQALETRLAGSLATEGPVRLALALLDLAERFGCRVGGGVEVDLDLNQGDLATLVGASRETVNRWLAGFRTQGLLRTSWPGSHAFVVDERGLRAFVEASE